MSGLVNAFTWGAALLVVVFPSIWYGYTEYEVVEQPSGPELRAPQETVPPDVAKTPAAPEHEEGEKEREEPKPPKDERRGRGHGDDDRKGGDDDEEDDEDDEEDDEEEDD